MIDHDVIEERIVAYVLGGMDPIERAAFEAELAEHRPGCDRCRPLFADLTEVSTRLALAAPAVRPPADLEDRIVALATGAQGPSAARPARSPWLRRTLGAAAAVVLLAAGFGAGALASRDGSAELRVAALRGRGPGSFAVAFVPGGRTAAIIPQGVADLPAGRVYQLWVRSDGRMLGAGTFDGSGPVGTTLPVAEFDLVAVTEEPAGGSEQPSGEPLASAQVR